MRRLLIITTTLCLLALSASAWAGPGNHRAVPGHSRQMVEHRTVGKGTAWGHQSMPRHPAPQWNNRPGHRYGQRHDYRSRYVARRCEPVHRRPVVVHERSLNRGSVLEYSIRIRTAD
ncbi:hypothetical protein [Pseudodesulfovibrio karagichevae]|uniref:Uncharacterized protein n=1 Tax=Pseudodesulfovibrio karagichevae TaxID=3239305 RepID=A0ABV4K2G1_9BACT